MKIRNGFVSNSSSSSFILIFPDEVYSVEKVKEMVFRNKKCSFTAKHYSGKESISSDEIAGFIFGQCLPYENRLETIEKLVNELYYNHSDGKYRPCDDLEECNCSECKIDKECPDQPNIEKNKQIYLSRKLDMVRFKNAFEEVENLYEKYPGYRFYLIEGGCQTSMPTIESIKEMAADMIGSNVAQGGSGVEGARSFYLKHLDRIILHPDARSLLENELEVIK